MNFLNPWAIGLGAAAIFLPVAIHFLTRPRPRSMPLSTIRFVQAAVKQRRARNLLRDVLVLVIRGLAIACIAFAFAQPRYNSESSAVTKVGAKMQRVVILDASQSMSATQSGVDGFQAARVQASRFFKPTAGVRANLIIGGANADAVFETPSSNMSLLTESLGQTMVRPERMDVQAAINSAAEMLAVDLPEVERELVIVSDFQRTNWATVDFTPLPESTKIRLESTAPAEAPDNLAIISVGFLEKPTVGQQSNLQVTLGNYSKNARLVRVEIAMADRVSVIEKMCPPNARSVLTEDILVQSTGWQTGWAKLLDNEDALAADDVYPFVVQSIATSTCTIVTRQPPSQRPSSSYFLERALAPSQRAEGQMKVERLNPARFNVESVAGSQLLVFDHPGRLQASQIKAIASLIRRGRGVVYVASELVDATNLKLLYDELGSDLQAPVEFVPPARGTKRKALTVNSVKTKLRPFSVFGDSLTASLADLRISGGLATRRVPGALDDDVLATLSDQSVLLFSVPAAMGNLCVLNADLNESNLPRHPTFVPILSELVEGLIRDNSELQTTYCGEPLTRLLPPSVTSSTDLVINSASGEKDSAADGLNAGEFRQSGDGVIWGWRRPTGPSVFQVTQKQETVYALASHLPPEESDLRTLEADVITQRLAGGRQVDFRRVAETDNENDKSWIWFAVAAVVALVSEVFVLKRFRT